MSIPTRFWTFYSSEKCVNANRLALSGTSIGTASAGVRPTLASAGLFLPPGLIYLGSGHVANSGEHCEEENKSSGDSTLPQELRDVEKSIGFAENINSRYNVERKPGNPE